MLIGGCATKKSYPENKPSDEERVWMKRFFEFLLFSESGAYTLYGEKPIVRFDISFYSLEELLKLQNAVEENAGLEDIVIEDYDFPDNWIKWEKVSDRFNLSQFLLFSKIDPDYPKLFWIFFVNVAETTKVIQKNYALFKDVYGDDFDPRKVVFEIEHESSPFWDSVSHHSGLTGLIYGFGEKNSFCFYSTYKDGIIEDKEVKKKYPFKAFSAPTTFTAHESVENFPIPQFVTFSEKDPVIKKYEKARKRIKKTYRGVDFVECTLKKLTEK